MGDNLDNENRGDSTKDDNFSLFDWGNNWIKLISALILAITPVLTAFNTWKVDGLKRQIEDVQYFQKEIKDSVEQLSETNSEKANVALASLYSLADDHDKKRILISIASSRRNHDLDEPIAYLVLSENEKERAKIVDNNSSLRAIARRLVATWILENYAGRSNSYQAIEQIDANADIRPDLTNASTQLLSLYSNGGLEGWILLGRFPKEVKEKLSPPAYGLSLERQLEIIEQEDFKLVSEGANIKPLKSEGTTISEILVKDLKGKAIEIASPVYIRQSSPSKDYQLNTLVTSSNTVVLGVLCQGDKVEILEYKPVQPGSGNYTLWGRVAVQSSGPCYNSFETEAENQT